MSVKTLRILGHFDGIEPDTGGCTVAWLKKYPLDGADWNGVQTLAAEAEGVGIARFSEADVVRHALVGRIVAAYNKKTKST